MKIDISNPRAVLIKSIEDRCGLNKYKQTLQLKTVNVASNEDYQKNFTGYYRVRRDENWLRKYYEFMEENKNNTELKFADVLRYLSNIPHAVKKCKANPSGTAKTIEVSFASKLYATINTDYPIWDSQVVNALGITIPKELSSTDKINHFIKAYEELKKAIDRFLETENGKECLREHDRLFPNFIDLSPVKKIDFFLWSMGN